VAQRLTVLESALQGQRLADAAGIVAVDHLAGLRPINDVRSTGAYRQDAALTLVRDVLAGFAGGAVRSVA
jgi:N-methylhydantoinase B